MKKIMTLALMMTIAITATALPIDMAEREALFLTDKMAYELNLTEEQYEAAYEINLDYLMGVAGRDDVFGTYWERRNLDLSYILYDWQWKSYLAASYFYRPLYWEAGYWHFGIYRRYPHRDYFYFGRPHFYATYRGGHAWHIHGTHGYYYGHRDHFRPVRREHFGMHDRWNRGDFRNPRHSSTRVTGRYDNRRIENRPDNRRYENRHSESHRNNSSFGGYRGGNNTPSRSIGNSSHSTRSFGGGSNSHSSSHSGGSHGGGSHGGGNMGGRR